ncbi:hypothetical protein C7441_112106 [Pseudaminobacter salicylatoxidans]|uniref:Lipoprotein n=1 Tax=Pseudaminobacter salicylatoxidans TaxID=93369 RepID=A0A316BZP7_PSESE|nr:hypothetical protein [Pseudaminobacter salicylatoxidans]PWJ80565.1 hypothetical protein C7441_112106 [Pseudaminobacter salicylatoxidans]
MKPLPKRFIHLAFAAGVSTAVLSGCAVGGGVFGTHVSNGTATTSVKAGSVSVDGAGVAVRTTEETVTTD